MKRIKDKLDEQKAEASKRQEDAKADMLLIAQHFSDQRGQKVLELLMRRARILASRFPSHDPDPTKAAVHDGEAKTVLFIIECLKLSGKTQITLPL